MKMIPFIDYFFIVTTGRWHDHIIIRRLTNFAKFLKLELALWMFVPTDKEGNVLKKPKGYDIYTNWEVLNPKFEQFKEAQDKVIFDVEDIEIIKGNVWFNPKDDHYAWKFKYHSIYGLSLDIHTFKTIEDLVWTGLTIKETAKQKYNL